MKKRVLSLALAVILVLGLAAPALAYQTPDFSDLPADNWAYGPVMRMADQGIIQGTGGGMFSPTMKVSAAQFLTLVGRIVFPETTVGINDTWYGPYVSAAQSGGLLAGTQVDVNRPETEITRYDMAVILWAAAKKLGKAETLAQQSQVTDFGMIPNMYTEAVLAVYGMGLITGDQNGNFNGSNTMMRNELATVIDRLVALKAPGGTTTEPTTSPEPSSTPEVTPSAEPEIPDEPVMATARTWGSLWYYPEQGKGSWEREDTTLVDQETPIKILYTEDGGKTSRLITELESDETGHFDAEFPMNKALLSNPNGQFYISAQFEKDGQLFVTQDLRTDGRKGLCVVHVFEKGHGVGGDHIKLVPPAGQRWDFELKGKAPTSASKTDDDGLFDYRRIVPAGFVIKLVYYPNPNVQDGVPTGEQVILGETITDEDGKFVLPASIDTLDMVSTENYRIEVSGNANGTHYFTLETNALRKLSDIWVDSKRNDAAWRVYLDFDK